MTLATRLCGIAAAFLFGFVSLVGEAPAQSENEAVSRLTSIVEAWRASPHADLSSYAFRHWNEEGEIPGSCAVCHSPIGFTDYVSGPMTTPGMIDHPKVTGGNVDCAVCHSESASMLVSVPFPSGVTVDTFDSSATCAVCHQGRASTDSVIGAVDGLEEDAVSTDLGFINVHYAPSAATLMGDVTRGGYQYDGKAYKGQFTHVPDFATCTDCHSPHALQTTAITNCVACHQDAQEFTAIRTSRVDFDGDGDISEGIADPIATLHGQLYAAIQSYGADVAGTAIIYADAFPYFFIDGDGDGVAGEGEAAFPNRYQSWTPRLLKAAYNYQFIAKDKAAYVHNPHYALQLLYDSLESLSESVEVDMASLARP